MDRNAQTELPIRMVYLILIVIALFIGVWLALGAKDIFSKLFGS